MIKDTYSWDLGSVPRRSSFFLFYLEHKLYWFSKFTGKNCLFYSCQWFSMLSWVDHSKGKIRKHIWYPKVAKNERKFSVRIQRAPKNLNDLNLNDHKQLSEIFWCSLNFQWKFSIIFCHFRYYIFSSNFFLGVVNSGKHGESLKRIKRATFPPCTSSISIIFVPSKIKRSHRLRKSNPGLRIGSAIS